MKGRGVCVPGVGIVWAWVTKCFCLFGRLFVGLLERPLGSRNKLSRRDPSHLEVTSQRKSEHTNPSDSQLTGWPHLLVVPGLRILW